MTKEAVDSFTVLRALFAKHPEPTLEQAREVSPALFDIYERLMRVRVVAPTVILDEKVYRLMDMVGIKGHRNVPARARGV